MWLNIIIKKKNQKKSKGFYQCYSFLHSGYGNDILSVSEYKYSDYFIRDKAATNATSRQALLIPKDSNILTSMHETTKKKLNTKTLQMRSLIFLEQN